MKNGERRSRAKWLRWAALVLLIAATPFGWLVARDTVLIWRASDGWGEQLARGNLVDRLVQTIRDSKISVNSREPMKLTMFFDPSCFLLEGGELRPSETPAAQSGFRDRRSPSLKEILAEHRFLADRAIKDMAESKAVSDSFSTSELILFNACIAATPFSAACAARVAKRRDAGYDKAFADVTRNLGIKAQRAGEPGQYCYTMPEVIDPPARRALSTALGVNDIEEP
ncbi:hypothetical protein [Sphingopyxis microcysteis]|uniref:hypothetical protein n=1 Tax=Sphingopyxis microcysteis TaxID=2484145 RepID=UPI00144630D6|nr:hypothetical protein [Sphingopyxis microcysteis]